MSEPRVDPPRVEISPAKGNEIVGLVLAAAALLGAASLGSFRPDDPSFLHQTSGAGPAVRNWVGSVGAEVAAAGFGLLGCVSLLLPLLLGAAAWRRLRSKPRPKVVGRGFGAALVLTCAPALCQLLAPRLVFRGVEIDSGGAWGVILGDGLVARMNLTGALVVLGVVFLVGLALVVQTSLGETLARWRRRLAHAVDEWRLARARRQERRAKERARRRVVVKHLQRVAEEREEKQKRLDKLVAPPPPLDEPESADGGRLDLPMRVAEKSGEPGFAVRRVAPSAPATARAAVKPPAPEPQKQFPFVADLPETPLPPISLLDTASERPAVDEDELIRLGEAIRARCAEFGVEGTIEGASPGPVITVFEFQPAPGVKVSQIVNLQDDLALAMRAESVRIERLAGRSTLGIEIPNTKRATIRLGEMLAHERFRQSPALLTLAIGKTIHGEPYFADLATMPHLLIAGATGSGKSIGLQ